MFALVADEVVVQIAADIFPVHPSLSWVPTDGMVPAPEVGWSYVNSEFRAPASEPEAPSRQRYVPVWLARERLEAAGHWDDLVTWLSSDMPRLVKLLTLAEGLDPEDPEVRAVLAAVGANADEILA